MAHHRAGTVIPRGRGIALGLGVLVALTLSLTSGCFRRTSGAAEGDSMTITADQIARLRASSAYDIVAQTHSEFFHSRGRESGSPTVPPTPVHVYVDDTYFGDVSTLRGIPVGNVEMIRLYQSYEAQYKFGSGHMGGVIQVITKH